MNKLNYKGEMMRKGVHLSSSLFPILMLTTDIQICRISFPLIAILFCLMDYFRLRNNYYSRIYQHLFGVITRSDEKFQLTGASYVFVSAAVCVNLFTYNIAIISLFCLSICDSFAAIIGIPFGKHKFFDKSLEGSIAFFISALAIFFIFKIQWAIALVCSLLGTLVESKKFPVNDNLLIPISIGLTLTIMLKI